MGKMGLMNGQTPSITRIPLPGGSTAKMVGTSGVTYILHTDWLGSARLTTAYNTRSMYYDTAYAPYGENYSSTSTSTANLDFTGQFQDTMAGLNDFLFREDDPVQGRWISPDRAGLRAVSLINPQSWNRYGYVAGNPMSRTDPLGLQWNANICGSNPKQMCTGRGIDGGNPGAWGEFDVIAYALTPTGYTLGPMTLWAETTGGKIVTGNAATAAYLAGDTVWTDEFPSVALVYGNIGLLNTIGQSPANNGTPQQPQNPNPQPTGTFLHPTKQQCRRENTLAKVYEAGTAAAGLSSFLFPPSAVVATPTALGLGGAAAGIELWMAFVCE